MITSMSFPEAISLATSREMQKDSTVFAFGVDAQDHKRAFSSGKGISEQFGEKRYFGSPLSEAAATGIALGAALSGLRPIHIHLRADFLLLAMNQICNMISNISYLSAGKLQAPLVIRAVIGRGWGQGAQHSKSMHSIFAHFPGLKVVLPTNPQDAYSLLRTAIRDPNPVIFLEQRRLYDLVGDVDDELEVPIGKCSTVRSGKDITVIASSWMTIEALHAADILATREVSVEVIDVRTIAPLDTQTIVQSVSKTGRAVITDYDWVFCGFSAEVSATLVEQCFVSLKSPPTRIGFAHVPCPTSLPLERLFYPTAYDIVRTIESQLGLEKADLSDEEFYKYENRFTGPF